MKIKKSKLDQIIKEEIDFVVENSSKKEIITEDFYDMIMTLPRNLSVGLILALITTFSLVALEKDPETGKRMGIKKGGAEWWNWLNTTVGKDILMAAPRIFKRLVKKPDREPIMKQVLSIEEQERFALMKTLEEKIPSLTDDLAELGQLQEEISKLGFDPLDLAFDAPQGRRAVPSHVVPLRNRMEVLLQKIRSDIEKAGYEGEKVAMGSMPREPSSEPEYHQ